MDFVITSQQVSNLVKRTILKIFCGGDIEEEESVT